MTELILDILRRRVNPDKVRHISMAKGGEWCSPCPVCGGDDRFRSWPNQDGGAAAQKAGLPGTWWCRQCDKTGDVISLLMFADGLTFTAACKELRIELDESSRRLRPLCAPRSQEQTWTPTEWPLPSEKWRAQATKLAQEAHAQLLEYPRALEYLASRGLPRAAVEQYRLGYLQAEDKKTGACLYRARSAFDLPDKLNDDGTKSRYQSLWIPRGFTIPLWHPSWADQQEAHRVRIRRPKGDVKKGDSKYMLLTGGGKAPMALAPSGVTPSLAVWVVTEAELDAIAVHHACSGRIGALAALTNVGKPDAAAHKLLAASPLILVALDFDPPDEKGKRPGFHGWEWWKKHYPQARRWPVPVGKDPGDAFKAGVDLAEWVRAGLPASLDFAGPGSLGAAPSGPQPQGDGERQAPPAPSLAPQQERPQSPRGSRRWEKAGPSTSLDEAVLPPDCGVTVPYLRRAFAGQKVSSDLLIPCPKTKPTWHWRYHKDCARCAGHHFCLLDFLLSPQMLAPQEVVHA